MDPEAIRKLLADLSPMSFAPKPPGTYAYRLEDIEAAGGDLDAVCSWAAANGGGRHTHISRPGGGHRPDRLTTRPPQDSTYLIVPVAAL